MRSRWSRQAKAAGLKITAEATPHGFCLTDAAVSEYDTNAKMNPPLRSQSDVDAVRAGLADGTIDAIASDHAPHHINLKMLEFDKRRSELPASKQRSALPPHPAETAFGKTDRNAFAKSPEDHARQALGYL